MGRGAAERGEDFNTGSDAGVGDGGEREIGCSDAVSPLPNSTVFPRHSLEAGGRQSTVEPRGASSRDKEECSTGEAFVDCSAERAARNVRQRQGKRTGESGGSQLESRWTETLLECLLP